jgi:putative redox protein
VTRPSAYRVESVTVDGGPTSLVSAGGLSLVADRPADQGGRGPGFSGGQLLYAAVAACISNDLYREAATHGIRLERVALTVDGGFPARGLGSLPITVDVEVSGDAPATRLRELVAIVDQVAEIPNSMRGTTPVEIRLVSLTSTADR